MTIDKTIFYILDSFINNDVISDDKSSEGDDFEKPGPSQQNETVTVRKKGNFEIMTPKLAAALDRCKISDRNALHILIACAEALGNDVNKLIINRTSIRNSRLSFRKSRADNIRKGINYLLMIQ